MSAECSLYIHIPFCAGACDYCDFFSVPVSAADGLLDNYTGILLGDITGQMRRFAVGRVPTVYIGGGTPSVLGAARMGRLLEGLSALLSGLDGQPEEFTVEANPESADEDFLRACREGGVNRISLGIQSFHELSRRAVRRIGEAALLDERLELVSRYFPGAFSADLMAGLPFQTEAVLLSDIDRLLAYKPAHVSLYSLTLERETVLAHRARRYGRTALSLPDTDRAGALWLSGREALEKAGYAQYEVSSFAPPEKRCIHNIRYWRMESWLAAGPSASGTIINDETGTGCRYTWPPGIDAFFAAGRPSSGLVHVEQLDRSTLLKESLLMGFRYCGGPDAVLFRRRFGRDITGFIPQTIDRWRERGFFNAPGADGGLAPSPQGLLFLDAFLRDAFAELENVLV
ncbi:MAG: radical SAM family heme chaperone HemW [Treponema sp.]|nr:radical SAM family heme chaperone HemW [Treponema sp.]